MMMQIPLPLPSRKEPEMGVWCAWCGKHLGGPVEAEAKTHGICQRCLEAVLADLEALKGETPTTSGLAGRGLPALKS